ncbi:MAG: formylglycine-generating enzyme family protein [Fibromonadaceae bacterium]|nr:formylglycine-generating enzyme family protein [Fibromonadaceae bacterium]
MKTALPFILAFSLLSFAGEKKGNRISKSLYRYRYKAEAGAYIEASRKETFSVCPDKKIAGTWISEYSVALNAENCVSVQVPNLAGTFRILFLQNSGRTDTVQILVEQSYIQMGDYTHKMYTPDKNVIDSITRLNPQADWRDVLPGNYESRKYDPSLIVDKTKFTMGDAQYYLKTCGIRMPKYRWDMVYPNEKLEESRMPYIGGQDVRFANERSKKEGLDTAYISIDIRNYNIKDAKNHILLGDTNAVDASYSFLLIDTSASGYRLPYKEEWFFLMRAGASTRYYWGDKEDSLKVSRYAWVNPVGLKPVAQLLPNRFGLYDMVGMTDETIITSYSYVANGIYHNYHGFASSFGGKCPECYFMRETRTVTKVMKTPPFTMKCVLKKNEMDEPEEKCVEIEQKPRLMNEKVNFSGFRLVRKTPKLHKLEKF